jgi:hypothetical protein
MNSTLMEAFRALSLKGGPLDPHVMTRPGIYTPGKWAHMWEKYRKEIEAIVREEKLQAIHIERERLASPSANDLIWWNPAGGWPLPHYHLGDSIYAVTQEQWQKFGSQVLATVGAQLQKASAKVMFDQVMEITEATAGMQMTTGARSAE